MAPRLILDHTDVMPQPNARVRSSSPRVDPGDESARASLPSSEACARLNALLAGETDRVANAANTSAFLNEILPDLNWVGFYFLHGDELVLGPFQGSSACVRIAVGKGVCGTCVAEGVTQRVDDVHAFPGHIACDLRSRSELVIPLRCDGEIIGVLDLDSPFRGRFSARDQRYIEALAGVFEQHLRSGND